MFPFSRPASLFELGPGHGALVRPADCGWPLLVGLVAGHTPRPSPRHRSGGDCPICCRFWCSNAVLELAFITWRGVAASNQLTGSMLWRILAGTHRQSMGPLIGGTLAVIVLLPLAQVGLLEPARCASFLRSPWASDRRGQFFQFRGFGLPPSALETLDSGPFNQAGAVVDEAFPSTPPSSTSRLEPGCSGPVADFSDW